MNYQHNKNIYIGISEKKDGSMKGSPQNSLLLFKDLGLDKKIIASADLVHGNRTAIVSNGFSGGIISKCDALISNNPKHLLTLTVADCLPLYFFDKKKKVVALAHAGWRGIVLDIAKEVIDIFINHYNSKASDIEVFIGPHIQACHFEVKSDVALKFRKEDILNREGKIYINLAGAVKNQLQSLSILQENIYISSECTHCLNDKYFSFRRDNPKELETMVAYIGLK